MWIFGGSHGSFGIMNFSNEVFCLDTNKVPPEWVQVNASGYIPPIQSAAAAMDSRDRLWVMGGTAQPDGSGGITRAFEDVFYLDTQQDPPLWVNASTSGTVLNQTRKEHVANMDSRGLLWIFGGRVVDVLNFEFNGQVFPYHYERSTDSVIYLDTKQEPLAWVNVVPNGKHDAEGTACGRNGFHKSDVGVCRLP